MFDITTAAQTTAGIVLLAASTVASGGWLLLQILRGSVAATDFQKAFYRAGHTHAGVLITLGLVCLLLTETTSLTGGWLWLSRTGVLTAAILMPAGFFFLGHRRWANFSEPLDCPALDRSGLSGRRISHVRRRINPCVTELCNV